MSTLYCGALPLFITQITPPDTSGGSRRLCSLAETSTHFQVSTDTIERWRNAGRITAFRVSGQRALMYDINEIDLAIRMAGPSKMRDGRKRGRGRVVPVVLAVREDGQS